MNQNNDPIREAFEHFITASPFEREVDRRPEDPIREAWPGSYVDYEVDLAWETWQEAWRQSAAQTKVESPSDYDAGLLSDFGGGDVGWWQDYIRSEIGRANDYWRDIHSQGGKP